MAVRAVVDEPMGGFVDDEARGYVHWAAIGKGRGSLVIQAGIQLVFSPQFTKAGS